MPEPWRSAKPTRSRQAYRTVLTDEWTVRQELYARLHLSPALKCGLMRFVHRDGSLLCGRFVPVRSFPPGLHPLSEVCGACFRLSGRRCRTMLRFPVKSRRAVCVRPVLPRFVHLSVPLSGRHWYNYLHEIRPYVRDGHQADGWYFVKHVRQPCFAAFLQPYKKAWQLQPPDIRRCWKLRSKRPTSM